MSGERWCPGSSIAQCYITCMFVSPAAQPAKLDTGNRATGTVCAEIVVAGREGSCSRLKGGKTDGEGGERSKREERGEGAEDDERRREEEE
eukprot:1555010-Rhodomonas_salina.1